MLRHLIAWVVIWLALSLTGAGWAAAPISTPDPSKEIGRRRALVIGNADYQHVTPLRNPVNDSQALCAALKALRFETDCRQNLPDRRSLREAVRNFTKALKPEDVALFYFAGHGVEVDGENYLIPTEADMPARSYVEDEALRLGFVFDELREARVRLSILVLDACRDNPFSKVRSSAGSGLSAPASMPAGSIIIFPTSPGRVAHDGAGRNGLFTTHLLSHLSSPGITIEEMFKRVIDGVRSESVRLRQEQIPWMNLSFTGEFCFVGCGTRVSTDQYLALVREKQQVEQITAELQNQLTQRQDEVATVRQRMQAMEARLSQQQQVGNLSRSQQASLASERQELAEKTVRLERQQTELTRLNEELVRLQGLQAEYQRREGEMAASQARIAQLEQQLTLQDERKITLAANEVSSLRKERQSLLEQQRRTESLQTELTDTRQRLERVQQALTAVDKQRRELDDYKLRTVRLESEGQKKDEALRAMRTDLETREQELSTVHSRLASLQQELQLKTKDSKTSESLLTKLVQERDALAQSSSRLAERDRELRQLREQLLRLESRQAQASQLEQNIARSDQRIAQLEAQLSQTRTADLSSTELAVLRRERDELKARNQAMSTQLGADQDAQREAAELRRRLTLYDQQQAELVAYKNQLMEAEKRLKDAAAATVKGAAFVAPAM